MKPYYYPLTLVGAGVIFIFIFRAVAPAIFNTMLSQFQYVFTPGGSTAATTDEMRPFFSLGGEFSTAIAWVTYTTSFFLTPKWPIPGFGIVSFLIMIYLAIKYRGEEQTHLFFIVWTLVILVATSAQRRFAYYMVVNIAVLSAYVSWQIIWLAGLRKLAAQHEQGKEEINPAQKRTRKIAPKKQGISVYYANTGLAMVVVFVAVFLFNLIVSVGAAEARFAISDGWQTSLSWMKENTPDPLGDSEAYYKLYPADYQYPESAYGVTSWWDYGYWIMYIARRPPSTNGSQAPGPITKVAKLFLSRDESQIQNTMDELDSSYIVADYSMSTSKFWAIVTWASAEQTEFYETYFVQVEGNRAVAKQLYYPEYYQSILVRLYNFDGKAVTSERPVVVSYEEITDRDGYHYKVIEDTKEFSSYREALDFVANQKSGNYKIVGVNPFISPVPLEEVSGFNLVHSSKSSVMHKDLRLLPEVEVSTTSVPEVKIFEYTK